MKKLSVCLLILLIMVACREQNSKSKSEEPFFCKDSIAPETPLCCPHTGAIQIFSVRGASLGLSPLGDQKLTEMVKEKLDVIGGIIPIKARGKIDIENYGGHLLEIRAHPVLSWNEKKLPITRITLKFKNILHSKEVGKYCESMSWENDAFIDTAAHPDVEDDVLGAIDKLLAEFTEKYPCQECKNKDKPGFYLHVWLDS